MASYDPNIIQKHADRLYRSANLIVVLCVVLCGLPGVVMAAAGQSGIFVFLGVAVGAGIGVSLAFNLKLKAQLALCQLQIEANTRATMQAVAARPPPMQPHTMQ